MRHGVFTGQRPVGTTRSRNPQRQRYTPIIVAGRGILDELSTLDAQNVTIVERKQGNTVKVAQAFYRKTGGLFVRPQLMVRHAKDEEIWRLFFPALFALVLEPVQALIDTSIVGRIGTPQLGAVGLGTVAFQFILGFFSVFIFATTPLVADDVSRGTNGSRITGKGIRMALLVGMVLQVAVMFASPHAMGFLSSDGTIAKLADEYLEARAWGIPGALIMMVGIGASRGHKDMTAPFLGSVAYGVSLALFDTLFVLGLHTGVQGAGYSASISQWVGAFTVMYMLYRNGTFNLKDAVDVPVASDILPYLSMAPSLALGSAAALAPMLVSSSIVTNLGPDQLASHTILRQISTFWIQLFMAYGATAHSMVASSLSTRTMQGMSSAAESMERICHLALITSIPLSASLYICRSFLPILFTDNGIVNSRVETVLPMLLVCAPVDALGLSIEGGILGAADTKWIAIRTVVSSVLSLAALEWWAGEDGSLSIVWLCLKVLNISIVVLDLCRFMGPTTLRRSVSSR